MEPVIILVPLVLVLVTILYGVLYTILRTWLDYRLKMAMLEKLDLNPRLLESKSELSRIIGGDQAKQERRLRQDYLLTGAMMAGIGLACALFGRFLRVGDVAVGAYLGGVICLLLGIVLALLGAVIKVLSRDPTVRLASR